MKNTDNHMNIDDYTRIVNQLRNFTNKDSLASEHDARTFTESDLDGLKAVSTAHWQAQADALELSVQRLTQKDQGKLSQIKNLAQDIQQGFLYLSLNSTLGKKGYLTGTSLEKSRASAMRSDWEKVGAHLVVSMRHQQNS